MDVLWPCGWSTRIMGRGSEALSPPVQPLGHAPVEGQRWNLPPLGEAADPLPYPRESRLKSENFCYEKQKLHDCSARSLLLHGCRCRSASGLGLAGRQVPHTHSPSRESTVRYQERGEVTRKKEAWMNAFESEHHGLFGEKGLKSNTYRGRAALGWREAVRGCQCCSPEMEVTPEEKVVHLKIPRFSMRRKEGRRSPCRGRAREIGSA